MNEYDQAVRLLARRDAIGFVRWIATDLDPAITFVNWLDTRNVPSLKGTDRTGDLFALLDDPDEPQSRFVLAAEVMRRVDPESWTRSFCYAGELYRDLRRDLSRLGLFHKVVPALLNLSGSMPASVLRMQLRGCDLGYIDVKVLVRNAIEDDAAETLEAIAADATSQTILPLVALMKGGGESAIMGRWREVASAVESERDRRDLAALVVTLAQLVGSAPEWEHALRGWDVELSPFIERFWVKGRDEGKEEGLEEGREEGQVLALRRVLLAQLRRRFGSEVEAADVEAIERILLDNLEPMINLAITGSDLATIRRQIADLNP